MPGHNSGKRSDRKQKSHGRSRAQGKGALTSDFSTSMEVSKVWPKPSSINFGKLIGFPDRLECNLRYSEFIDYTASPTPAAQVWRMNSLFDPNLTGVGHQPNMFDQISAIYGEYVVVGAQADLTWVNTSSTQVYVVGALSDTNISAESVENLMETKYNRNSAVAATSGGPATKKMTLPYMSSSQIQGQKQIESDPNMYSAITTNPNDMWYLIAKCASSDGVSNVTDMRLHCTITFRCVFKGLTTPGESLVKKEKDILALVELVKSKK